MPSEPLQLKIPSKIAVAVMGILLLGALFFYKERMLFSDASLITFRILNEHKLVIGEHRYGCFITQGVLLICTQMHLSLKTILICYSASFNFFYLGIICLLVWRFRQYQLAILMALYYTLFVSDGYFWTNDEVHQGVAWMFLALGVVLNKGGKNEGFVKKAIPFSLFAFLAIYTHFLVIIMFSFLWFFLWSDKSIWPFGRKQSFILLLVCAAIVCSRFILLKIDSSYDDGKMSNITEAKISDVIKALSSPGAKYFLYTLLTNYWVCIPIFIAGITALVRQKRTLQIVWVLLALLGMYSMLFMVFRDKYDSTLLFYMESEYMGMGVIISAAFVFYFSPQLKSQTVVVLVIAIFVVRLGYIAAAVPKFVDRLNFIAATEVALKNKHISKAIIPQDEKMKERLLMSWGTAYESILLSALNNDSPSISFCMKTKDADGPATNDAKIFQSNLGNMPMAELNHCYFNPDTIGVYKIMTAVEITTP